MTDSADTRRLLENGSAQGADQSVLSRVTAGQLDALEELYERYGTMAYSIAYRVTGDRALAEDVVQEAFIGAWRSADRYVDARASVKTWLLAIVHHRAVDAVRGRRPTTALPGPDAPAPPELQIPGVWAEVAGTLDREEIVRALAGLPAAQLEAIELAYFGGFTQQEIAARTNAPLGTVKGRLRLGLLALRRTLMNEGQRRGGEGNPR